MKANANKLVDVGVVLREAMGGATPIRATIFTEALGVSRSGQRGERGLVVHTPNRHVSVLVV